MEGTHRQGRGRGKTRGGEREREGGREKERPHTHIQRERQRERQRQRDRERDRQPQRERTEETERLASNPAHAQDLVFHQATGIHNTGKYLPDSFLSQTCRAREKMVRERTRSHAAA
eukprot:3518651-Pleurochrysis_carterae.AAC.2